MGTIPVSNEMTVYSWALVTLLCVQHKKKTAHGKLFIPPSVITLTEWVRWSAEGMHMHSVITGCPALCSFLCPCDSLCHDVRRIVSNFTR
jgi:hypothetical protein